MERKKVTGGQAVLPCLGKNAKTEHRFRFFWIVLFIVLAVPLHALAAADAPPRDEAEAELESLSKNLDSVDKTLDYPWTWRSRLEELRNQVEETVKKAEKIHGAEKEYIARQKALIDALAPDSNSATGSQKVPKQFPDIESELARHQSRLKSAALIVAKAKGLKDRINSAVNRLTARALINKERSLFDGGIWRGAARELTFAVDWARGLMDSPLSGENNNHGGLMRSVTAIVLTLLMVAWVSFRISAHGFLTRSHRDPTEVAHGFLLHDMIPLGIVLFSLLLLRNADVVSYDVYKLSSLAVIAVAVTLFLASIVSSLPHLAGWLTRLVPGQEAKISVIAVILSVLVGINLFLSWAERELTDTPDLFLLGQFAIEVAVSILVATAMWYILRVPHEDCPAAGYSWIRLVRKRHKRAAAIPALPLWFVPMTVIVVEPLIFALGYRNLSDWLFFGIWGTVGAVFLVWFASAYARKAIPAMLKRWFRPAFVLRLGRRFSRRRMRVYTFWIFAVVQSVLWLAAGVSILLLWGVQFEQLKDWSKILLGTIQIGTISISLVGIIMAFATVIVLMGITKIVQRILVTKVFPHFEFDIGARNAIRSGIGYLGGTIAIIVAVLSLGVELTHIALVAGGLSLGIGFGLQAVANNFISGLIMLLERPIKEGDWIVVKDHEGLVRHISFRATELQTFQKASVLIPNSELISGTVTNWTFKDLTSRVEVVVGISYDADEQLAKKLLLSEADKHPRVLRVPAPQVNLREFGDNALIFELWAYIEILDVADKHRVESELRLRILAALRAHGIGIPCPQRQIHIADFDGLVRKNRTTATASTRLVSPAEPTRL